MNTLRFVRANGKNCREPRWAALALAAVCLVPLWSAAGEVAPPPADGPSKPKGPKVELAPIPLAWDIPIPSRETAGKEYFVSAKTGDDANPGSAEKPWKTINFAAGKVEPGDTVTVTEGEYRESVKLTKSGETGKWITFRAKPGDKVLMEGSALEHVPAFDWREKPYRCIRIEGFDMRAFYWGMTFKNCRIEDCEFINLTFRENRGTGDGRGFGMLIAEAKNVLFHSCVAHDLPDLAFAIRKADGVKFVNCKAYRCDDGLGDAGDADGFGISSGKDVLFLACDAWGNSEDGFDAKIPITLRNCRTSLNYNGMKVHGGLLENCIIANNKDMGISLRRIDEGGKIVMRNCTFYGNPESVIAAGREEGAIRLEFANNIVAASPSAFISGGIKIELVSDNNVFALKPGGSMLTYRSRGTSYKKFDEYLKATGLDKNSKEVSLEAIAFKGAEKGDVAIARNSAAIGIARDAATKDATGRERTAKPAAGAYEPAD
jgi:hypothetical protein